jgi:alpha-L-fucosidase
MYKQGGRQYEYHVKRYGHPSKFGFKDVIREWKAEQWDPQSLVNLYKRAGAKYFVGMANHHDNFDLWDSKYQEWNSVRLGPKKDIIGGWAAAARKAGLRFGATVHCRNTWGWYDRFPQSDKEGPYQGVPYDRVLTKAEGKGTWWEGLDPQELYCENPGKPPSEAYWAKYVRRVKDLIAQHKPDLLYFDDRFDRLGERWHAIAAHYYNSHRDAVMNLKDLTGDLQKAYVNEIESGQAGGLEPLPWQSDQCIGDWHYRKGVRYQTAGTVIPWLVDIVSKNGNLMLNIPVRGNGTIDEEELKFVAELTRWMDVNGVGIFETRPWTRFGEGPTNVKGGRNGNKDKVTFTAEDIRFTTKGKTLYAFLLGWPEREVSIKSLAGVPVRRVRMLGVEKPLSFVSERDGLRVTMPASRPCEYAWGLEIERG